MPQGVNYLAVLIVAVIIFLLGGLWYSPVLFAKRWVALQNKSMEEMQSSGGAGNYLQVFICGLVIAYVLAVVIGHFTNHPMTWLRGAEIGVLVWLATGAASYGTALFSMKPRALWAIDSGFNLVSMIIAGAILGVWH